MRPRAKSRPKSQTRRAGGDGLPRQLAAQPGWDLELDRNALRLAEPAAAAALGAPGGELADLVAAVRPGCELEDLERFVVSLRDGGVDFRDDACALGGVELSLSILEQGSEDVRLLQQATDVLYYLASDFDGCVPFIRNGGQATLIRLLREQGPQDQLLAISGFRTLANTLYNEDRRSDLWRSVDFDFVVQALAWALREDVSSTQGGVALLGSMLDIAALWCQRSASPGQEVAGRLVALLPMLLQRMHSCMDDGIMIAHVCRFLWVLATQCRSWPAAVREPAGIALSQLQVAVMFTPNPHARDYCGMALQAVSAVSDLDTMD